MSMLRFYVFNYWNSTSGPSVNQHRLDQAVLMVVLKMNMTVWGQSYEQITVGVGGRGVSPLNLVWRWNGKRAQVIDKWTP